MKFHWLIVLGILLSACRGTLEIGIEQTPPRVSLTATATPAFAANVIRVSFEPASPTPLDRRTGFSFGAELEFDCDCDTVALVTAYFLRSEDSLPDCRGGMNVNLPFWAEQESFSSGPHTFGRKSFSYSDEPSASSLVIRASLLSSDRVLYCTQQVYPLTASSAPTPEPNATAPAPGAPYSVGISLSLQDRAPGGEYIASSSPVIVQATAPDAVRVDFYTSSAESLAAAQLQFTDTDGGDGWAWSWPAPTSGMWAQVWAEASYADGSRMASPALRVVTPNVVGSLPTPTPLPTLTASPSLTPLVPPPDTGAVWSPDHKWYATREQCFIAVVVDPERERVARLPMTNTPCGQVWSWTADSRFVIFGDRHPKGNAVTFVFDVQQWSWVMQTPGCTIYSTGDLIYWDSCGEYPVALSPNAPRFLMENGQMVNLPDARQTDLLPDLRDRKPLIQNGYDSGYLVRWSPDGAYLAFVVVIYGPSGYSESEYVLYLALGDGTQVRQVMMLESYPRSLQWAEDGRTVVVAADAGDVVAAQTYIVNALTGQAQITPGPPTSIPSATPELGIPTPAATMTPFFTPTP